MALISHQYKNHKESMTFLALYLYYHFLFGSITTLFLIGLLVCLDLFEITKEPKVQYKKATMETCVICFDRFGSDVVYKTASCTHYSCQSCLAGYFLAYQEPPKYDYTVIPCPMPGCPHTFKAHPALHQVLNAEQAQGWWRNAIEKSTLDNIVSLTCPPRYAISE